MRHESLLTVPVVWTCPRALWGLLAISVAALVFVFLPALQWLYAGWMTREEYSFGILVPFIAAFLLWQRRDQLAAVRFEGSGLGVLVLIAGLGLGVLAYLATARTFAQYAFLASLAGVTLAFVGTRQFGLVAAPLGMLLFMLPLPELFLSKLSASLQIYSSQLGVWLIRLAGVSVYLEGNVIDLGTMKLQVVEACSGLRYLLPLMTLGFITAYFFSAPMWQRVLLVASTAPITLLMNSARIALVGITVEHFGRDAAEGLLHDFEGWAVFVTCMAVLFAEMWLFARARGRGLRDVFGIGLPGEAPAGAERRVRPVPGAMVAGTILLVCMAAAYAVAPRPASLPPERREFAEFPLLLGAWRGRLEKMNPLHLDVLRLDDYLLATYADGARGAVNLYIAYYGAQRNEFSEHSPTVCLPGDGWEIRRFERHVVSGVQTAAAVPLAVNRVIIQKGESQQLVYYWFKQRERNLTGEYAVKTALVWDLLTRQRSDGALVRLTTAMRPGEAPAAADERLRSIAAEMVPLLPAYVPG
jgi:exosortase D (VPLPA-CTERM-specific)